MKTTSHYYHLSQSRQTEKRKATLHIEGKWLHVYGFEVGDLVEIIPEKETLTIKLVEKWKSPK